MKWVLFLMVLISWYSLGLFSLSKYEVATEELAKYRGAQIAINCYERTTHYNEYYSAIDCIHFWLRNEQLEENIYDHRD